MDPSDAFSLNFTNGTRVAGRLAEGTLILNIPLLRLEGIEEVHINLRGQLTTKIGCHEEIVYPFHDTIGVWKQSSLSEDELRNAHVTREPFSFVLPYSGAASGEYGQEGKGCSWPARVFYYVEAVAVHSDSSKADIRTDRLFKYLNADARGAELSNTLQDGWTGNWQMTNEVKKLCTRFSWKANREATITLSLPQLDVFPIRTAIPFRLNVLATAKGKKSQPTTESSRILGIDFTIVRDVHIKAHSEEMTIEKEFVARIGSFGLAEDAETAMVATSSPWMPVYDDEKEPTGTWRQENDVASSFTLACPPSVVYQNLSVKYFAQVKITSLRTGSAFITIPLKVVSNCY